MAPPQGFLSRILGTNKGSPVPVVLYTKRVCPLCDEAKDELARVRTRIPWSLEIVEIDGDPELEARYGLSVPVISILGRPAFKGRLTVEEFVRKLERRAGNQN